MDDHSVNSGDHPGCGPILLDRAATGKSVRQDTVEYVRAYGAASRVDIARALNVSPGSMTSVTSELIQSGYLHEVEGPPRESGRGRPPVALSVNPDVGFVVGIKLSDRSHTATLLDFAGNQIHYTGLPSEPGKASSAHMIEVVTTLLTALLDETGTDKVDILGLGIGMPGLVNHDDGRVIWSPLLNMREVDLAPEIERITGLPTAIDNDANVLTLAEQWFGKGRDMSSFAVVTIENGIGMGFVLNQQLFRGVRGLGMELGHTKVQLDGALCRCGKRGCLEAYLSDYALVREASTALSTDLSQGFNAEAIMAHLFQEAKSGNAAAKSIFLRAGRFLSLGLSNVMHLFDPERIIISGERITYDYFFSEGVLSEMLAMTLDADRFRDRVEIHAWGDQIWAKGAGALALSAATNRQLGT